ncbi:MAG: aldo/keto reductase [Nitrospira sp.]|nr:aldo/keto reductase [Nitrospira sp.]
MAMIDEVEKHQTKGTHPMKYRNLGNSGTVVSPPALGTMYFGDETAENDAFAILDAFIEAGGNLVDTSNVYVGGVAAPIFGARNLRQLDENLAAAELTLDENATKALEVVSAPRSNGYPYGSFGAGQRNRDLHNGIPAPGLPVAGGSDHPLGRI